MDDHPLADSYLKVERAKELLEALVAEIQTVSASNPLEGQGGVDRKTGEHFVRIKEVPTWPPKWAVMVGEITHNLRSALDYIVFQLAGGPEGKRTAFPIAEEEGPYFRKRGRRPSYRDECLGGIDSAWAEKIDDLQPFRNKSSRLPVLNWLSNRDKHRVRHACLSIIETPIGRVWVEDSERVRNLELRRASDGALSVRFEAQGPRRKGDRMITGIGPEKPGGQFEIKIVFGDRCVSPGNLVGLITEVESILDGFKPAFDPAPTAD